MLRWSIYVALCAGLSLLDTTPVRAQDAAYAVEGSNPGDADVSYRGLVMLKVRGQSVTVVWKIQEQVLVGTGVVYGNTMAVGFPGTQIPGAGLYTRDPDSGVVKGIWMPGGGQLLGTEKWTPVRAEPSAQ